MGSEPERTKLFARSRRFANSGGFSFSTIKKFAGVGIDNNPVASHLRCTACMLPSKH